MATIINKPKTDQTDTAQGQTMSNNGPAYMGMGASSPQAPAAPGAPRFTNIQQFLGANVGAGQKLAGKVLEQKSTLEGGIQSSQDTANKVKSDVEAQTGKIKTSGEQAAEAIKGINAGQQYINQDKPTEEFTNLYTGQNGLPQYQQQVQSALGQTQQAIDSLGQFGQKLGTESGRNELLSGSVGKAGKYGAGLSTLDQILLQRGGRNQLESAVGDIRKTVPGQLQQYQNLQKSLTDADTGVLSQLGKQSASTQDLLKGTLTGEQDTFEKAQQDEASKLSGERGQQQELMKQFLSSGYTGLNANQQKMINDTLAAQGLSAGQRLYSSADPAQSFKYGQAQLGAQDVVDSNELARYKALSTLAGVSPDALKYTAAGGFGGGQAISVDPTLSTGIDARQEDYSNKMKQTALPAQELLFALGLGSLRVKTPDYSYGDLNKVKDIYDDLSKTNPNFNQMTEAQRTSLLVPNLVSAGLLNPSAPLNHFGIAKFLMGSLPKIEDVRQQSGYYNRLGGNSMDQFFQNANKGK